MLTIEDQDVKILSKTDFVKIDEYVNFFVTYLLVKGFDQSLIKQYIDLD